MKAPNRRSPPTTVADTHADAHAHGDKPTRAKPSAALAPDRSGASGRADRRRATLRNGKVDWCPAVHMSGAASVPARLRRLGDEGRRVCGRAVRVRAAVLPAGDPAAVLQVLRLRLRTFGAELVDRQRVYRARINTFVADSGQRGGTRSAGHRACSAARAPRPAPSTRPPAWAGSSTARPSPPMATQTAPPGSTRRGPRSPSPSTAPGPLRASSPASRLLPRCRSSTRARIRTR